MSFHREDFKTIPLEIVTHAARRLMEDRGIKNTEIRVVEHTMGRIAFELVAHIAKHRVNHEEEVRYPADWKEALKEQLLNVWRKDPKKERWIKLIPKRLLRKFVGNGVKYTVVTIKADAFFPAIEIPRDYRSHMYVHTIRTEERHTPWTDEWEEKPEPFKEGWKPTDPRKAGEWPNA